MAGHSLGPADATSRLWFFCLIDGRILRNHEAVIYWPGRKNEYFRDMLKKEYENLRWQHRHSWWTPFRIAFREIGFVYFDLVIFLSPSMPNAYNTRLTRVVGGGGSGHMEAQR